MGVVNRELGVGRGARGGDCATAIDFAGTPERCRVCRGLIDRRFQHFGDGDGTILGRKNCVHTIALRLPFVLNNERTPDGRKIGIAPAVCIKVPGNGAVQRSNRDGILN